MYVHSPYQHSSAATTPSALEMVPVTYVSFAEAASYCKAMGKRLPSTIEWQYAAQGTTQRVYPWGNALDPACLPPLETGRTIPGAKRVDAAYPSNCSSDVSNTRSTCFFTCVSACCTCSVRAKSAFSSQEAPGV